MTALDEPVAPTARERSLPRSEQVADAAADWADELAALGGRDPLLNFRDLKVGTLDLAAADPEARKRLLDGDSITVTRLFPHEPLRSSALRSVRAIRDKARELREERGLAACVLAVGIATWADPFSAHRPTAPVLLRPATVTARDPAETDFVIEMTDEPEINPVLLHTLDMQLGLRFEPDDLRDATGTLRYPVVVERMREFAPAHVIDGFSIAHRAVLGTFTKEPLALALDLAAVGRDLEQNDVIAALAGAADAPTWSSSPSPGPAENIVLDADWGQHAVVATVVAGSHLRVDAPAGTGRTQTIANLVAELVGRGKSVLVVSAKQARLQELVSRLAGAGLEDVVLDLSDGRTSSPDAVNRVAEVARRLADGNRDAPQPEQAAGADELREYCEALHRLREPWGTSAYDAIVAVVDAPAQARTPVTISAEALRRLDGSALQATRKQLREYVDLEGLTVGEGDPAWFGAAVPTRADAEFLAATVTDLREAGLPVLRDTATRAAVEVGLVAPQTTAECFETVTLLNTVGSTLDRFGPEIWAAPLDDMATATGDRQWRATHGRAIGGLVRRRLRGQARALLREPLDRRGLHQALRDARDQLAAWRERARDGRPPRVGAHLNSANIAVEAVGERLATLIEANPRTAVLADLPYQEAAKLLTELAADERHLLAIPRLSELAAELSAAGLDELIEVLREWRIGPEHVADALDYARNRSLLEAWRDEEPALRSFDPHQHERLVDSFRAADPGVLQAAVQRVCAARAQRFADAAGEFAGQAVVVESGLRGPRTPRELLVAAPDVALAAVPCWVMSPLVVASVLPARALFDVVIVEEAGRLPVAQAVPALARADQVVVIGDGQELTAAPFTTAVEPDVEPEELPTHLPDVPAQSVFGALAASAPTMTLASHYRARDHRLVGFPARVAYRGALVATPGFGGPSPLHHELIEVAAGEEPVDSATAEVARVVELVLEHARTRPHQSLGVITVGSRHAGRIDDALRRALVRSPDAARFIREDREEPFFVKNVERAVGDVRDAVILSIGYGRSVDGRVLYRFGALDRPGGNRLLTAAISTARERVTVVSAFTADDLSPRRLTTPGAQALRDFLSYVGATAEADDGHLPGDALDAAIADRLRAAGVDVVLGHGAGSARIPLAVRHPSRKDRLVLAIGTDGPAYAAQPTVRDRDRLRPEHLARLGWGVHRVWSIAWLDDPNRETERLLSAYERAVSVADAYDWAEAAALADDVVGMPEDEAGRKNAPATEPDPGESGQQPASSDLDEQFGPLSPIARGSRPRIPASRPIGAYTRWELAAMARWVESDGRARTEAEAITEIAQELGLPDRAPRAEDSLRHAVRVARAGAPPLWPDHRGLLPDVESQPTDVESQPTDVETGTPD
jgi:hypothetical protein